MMKHKKVEEELLFVLKIFLVILLQELLISNLYDILYLDKKIQLKYQIPFEDEVYQPPK